MNTLCISCECTEINSFCVLHFFICDSKSLYENVSPFSLNPISLYMYICRFEIAFQRAILVSECGLFHIRYYQSFLVVLLLFVYQNFCFPFYTPQQNSFSRSFSYCGHTFSDSILFWFAPSKYYHRTNHQQLI